MAKSSRITTLLDSTAKYEDTATTVLFVPMHKFAAHVETTFLVPDFQRERDQEKIEEIQACFLKKHQMYEHAKDTHVNWFMQQGCIILGRFNDKHYILDGMHRALAIKELCKTKDYDCRIEVKAVRFSTIQDMHEFFVHLNINTKISDIYLYFESEVIQDIMKSVRDTLKDKHKAAFAIKDTKKSLRTVAKFIEDLGADAIKALYEDAQTGASSSRIESPELLLDAIYDANAKAKAWLEELDAANRRRYIATDDWEKLKLGGFYLSPVNIDVKLAVFDGVIDAVHTRPAKRAIAKRVRDEVWDRHFGTSRLGACHCCDTPIKNTEFECGHVVAEARGGPTCVANLRPVCGPCNRDMGTRNMDEYRADLLKQLGKIEASPS